MTTQRNARYGRNLYQIRVHDVLNPGHVDEYFYAADSITVRDGVLMLAVEVDESDDSADGHEYTSVELPPVAIFSAGQWMSVQLVSWGDHQHLFTEAHVLSVIAETDEED